MKQVYLDNQSGTKLDTKVIDAMVPFFTEYYGNPQSIHSLGIISRKALEIARYQVSSLINASEEEIIFTSCGTESNNLAIKGIADTLKSNGKHIIVSSIEHISILNSVRKLKVEGFDISYLPVDNKGNIIEDELKKMLRKDTILVSIQYANPEIGTIQDIKKLVSIVKNSINVSDFIVFHSDAVSAFGIIPIDVEKLGVDILTFSSSVIHGPRGSAGLYVKKGIRISSQINGGGQENFKRSGTENLPSIVGFGKVCEIVKNEMSKNNEIICTLRNKLITELSQRLKYIYLNGACENRLPGNVNFSVEFVEGEALLLLLDNAGIMVSSGSACASKNLKSSYILSAIGVNTVLRQGSIIFTLSKFTTREEINYVLEKFSDIVSKLRNISSLYLDFIKTGRRIKV
ncbi:MAG: cysteine desulfurase [Endomicrobium sp.]|jgi:cysteine desulfurase|nr:cysteine desulfurase [Endomicrobium sp.]